MQRFLRILGVLLGLVVLLLVIVGGYVFAQSNAKFNETYEVAVFDYQLPETTDELLEEGERLFISRGCSECHGEDAGGRYLIEDPAMGNIAGTNLTTAHYDYTTEDYIRGIMYGVGHEGNGLLIMPSVDWTQLRQDELDALLVYLANLAPVERNLETTYGPLGRALVAFNQIPLAPEQIDFADVGLIELETSASIEFGEYVANNCSGCHGEDFAGAPVPGGNDVSANLTPHETGLAGWSLEDFDTAMREGVRPDGSEIDPLKMPWTSFANLTDTEIEALYLYFQSLDPIASE